MIVYSSDPETTEDLEESIQLEFLFILLFPDWFSLDPIYQNLPSFIGTAD